MTDRQPVVVSDRLRLRPLQPADAGLLVRHLGDPRVARATRSVPHPLPPDHVEVLISTSRADDRSQDVWAIDGSPSDGQSILGVVALERMDRRQSEVSYWIVPDAWGAGYASEAVRALVLSNPLDNLTIFAEVFQDNPASARVLTNAGFHWLGDAETFCVARDALVPTWTYSRKLG